MWGECEWSESVIMTPSTSLWGTTGLLLDRFSGHFILGVLPRCVKEILQRSTTGDLKMVVKFCMCKVVRNKHCAYSGFIGMINWKGAGMQICKHASMLHYMYISCLVWFVNLLIWYYRPVLTDLARILTLLNRPEHLLETPPSDWEKLLAWGERVLRRYKKQNPHQVCSIYAISIIIIPTLSAHYEAIRWNVTENVHTFGALFKSILYILYKSRDCYRRGHVLTSVWWLVHSLTSR